MHRCHRLGDQVLLFYTKRFVIRFFLYLGHRVGHDRPALVPGNGRCKGNRQISASVFKGSRRPVKDFSDSRGQGLEREWFNEYRLNRLRNVFAEGFIVRVTGHVENS